MNSYLALALTIALAGQLPDKGRPAPGPPRDPAAAVATIDRAAAAALSAAGIAASPPADDADPLGAAADRSLAEGSAGEFNATARER